MPNSECLGGPGSLAPLPGCVCIWHSLPVAESVSSLSVSPALAVVFAPRHVAVPPPQTCNAAHPQAGAETQPDVHFPVIPVFLWHC